MGEGGVVQEDSQDDGAGEPNPDTDVGQVHDGTHQHAGLRLGLSRLDCTCIPHGGSAAVRMQTGLRLLAFARLAAGSGVYSGALQHQR